VSRDELVEVGKDSLGLGEPAVVGENVEQVSDDLALDLGRLEDSLGALAAFARAQRRVGEQGLGSLVLADGLGDALELSLYLAQGLRRTAEGSSEGSRCVFARQTRELERRLIAGTALLIRPWKTVVDELTETCWGLAA
jgi:hypothetical protein